MQSLETEEGPGNLLGNYSNAHNQVIIINNKNQLYYQLGHLQQKPWVCALCSKYSHMEPCVHFSLRYSLTLVARNTWILIGIEHEHKEASFIA